MDELILDEFAPVLALPQPAVLERWVGVYPSAPTALLSSARRGCGSCVTSGTGASTAFGIAEEVFDDLLGGLRMR